MGSIVSYFLVHLELPSHHEQNTHLASSMATQAVQDYWFMISLSDKNKREHTKNVFWHLYFEKSEKKVKT